MEQSVRIAHFSHVIAGAIVDSMSVRTSVVTSSGNQGSSNQKSVHSLLGTIL